MVNGESATIFVPNMKGTWAMKQTVTIALCDWHDDGETEAIEPAIRWKEGDSTYELDLCRDCKVEHRAGARRIKVKPKPRVAAESNGHRTTVSRRKRRRGPQPSEIREWARGKGITVSDNGRIPADVEAAYKKDLAKV
jgi:hypothetical protein